LKFVTPISILICLAVLPTFAQQRNDDAVKPGANNPPTVKANPANESASPKLPESTEREKLLLERIEKLEKRLAELESRTPAIAASEGAQPESKTTATTTPAPADTSASPPVTTTPNSGTIAQAQNLSASAPTQKPEKKEPFAFADFTWMTGNPRTKESPIDTKVFTGEIRFDSAFHYSFNRPQDNTIGGSSEVFRSGELQLTQLGLGGDFHYNNVRGRFLTQIGMYSQTQPRNDPSPARGQWNLDNAYRYISEAYGGYHWDKMNGINVDAGIFLSYIGLWSFYNFDNWTYQPSFVSSNTPWFFN